MKTNFYEQETDLEKTFLLCILSKWEIHFCF